MLISLLLSNISVLSAVFPLLAAIYNYKHLDKLMKILALYLLISGAFDFTMWLAYNLGQNSKTPLNTIPLLHISVATSIVFFGVIYYNLFLKSALKKITLVLSTIVMLIVLYNARNIFDYPSVSNTASSILLIILSLVYFYQLLNPQKFIQIEKQGLFWVNAGVLVYSSVNIFLFMLFSQIPDKDKADYYVIFSITNIIANIIYSIGLLCKPQKTT